ncbi:SusC/RagA family TonB-linked outer membrane protein [Hymenobacter sp. BRD128]|uniref:SusC/RagA family TonB-linked outer membrane protein n=1 Tax=Hymenobacter sp. BRD128 TaxID=2675878 RepID=UPI0015630268|nr:SusC/RagA family TonB-linked outer membrane protein [Hymenobacter sp. BRD128]QKG58722.1 SusC/RagA family TonB-linked outer membrane protein [Hymenobacter sp. BRD128]
MKHFFLLLVFLLSCLWHQATAQDRNISGRVTDRSSGQGLPGVTVLAKGTTIGTSTNADGAFALSVPTSATTLTFSFVGYTTLEQPIGNGTNINVALATDSKQLGEVVVTGALGIQRQEREIGYATATLDTKEVTQARVTNVTNGLAGKVSGLQIQTLSAGVNPSVRVTLRGTRSVTGDNQALIVVDGVISTNEVLTSLNPDDIASVSVLKGANAAALYGSQAANGALIITTKKGGSTPQVTFSHTSQFESISFLPKFQTEFGPGANVYTNNLPKFTANNSPDEGYTTQYQGFENQQYGPRFDGSLRPFGEPLANGDQQMLSFIARPDEKRKFFNTGYQTQNGVSFSGGDEKSKFFASYQNVHNNGIVPKDKYDRNNFRFNASRELGKLTVGFNVSYSQQVVDMTSNLDRDNSVYWNIFNTTVMAPITQYKNWQTDEYANPNGYYNAYYQNPYFIIDNNRTNDKRSTLLGNIDLAYKVSDWFKVQYRLGTTSIDQSSIITQDKFTYNAYNQAGNTNKTSTGLPGFVQDLSSNLTRINSDLFVNMDKTFGDINVRAILGNNVQSLTSRYNFTASNALATPGLFNLANRVGELTGGDGTFTTHQYSFYADLTLGYKDFFYLHGSGRNDNISTLDAGNRSFFYPGVDASLIFTNAIPALRDASFLDYGKIRGGITKVSQVNLGNTPSFPNNSPANLLSLGVASTGGAYATNSVYGLGSGFPFGGLTSFTAGNQLVQPGLKPEETLSTEVGTELSFLKHRISAAFTYYSQKSTNQTLSGSVSRATGYSTLLLNAGEVRNNGVEVDLNLTPIRTDNGLVVTVGGNFNYNNNQIVSLLPTVHELPLTTGGNANLYATEGQPFPVLRGSYYQRTADGLIEMNTIKDPDGNTRYVPIKAPDTKIFGNTLPKEKYGMNFSVAYKGFTLAGQGEYRTGYVIYNTIGENLDFTGAGQRSASYGRQDFVLPNSAISNDGGKTFTPNTTGLTPGGAEFWASGAYNTSIAENYVTKGDFFKIRELSLSYVVPAALLTRTGFVKGASLNIYGRNLYTWVPKENIYTDPEFSFGNSGSNAVGINTVNQTPPTKFYGASITATF